MKPISQIAKECGLTYEIVYRTIMNEGIITVSGNSKRLLTTYQEDHIHNVLFLDGKFNELTFESKINSPDFEEKRFLSHKRKTYTKNS